MPHLWRELQAELLNFDRRLRGGAGPEVSNIETILEETFAPSTPEAGPVDLTQLLQIPGGMRAIDLGISPKDVHSLALAHLLASQQGEELSADVSELESALENETRTAFDAWMKKHGVGESAHYVEVRLLNRLSDAPQIDWSLLRLAAGASLAGERVAALDLLVPGWVQANVDRGDQSRCFGEELLIDQIGSDWRERAAERLQQASEFYAMAETDFVRVRGAQFRRDVILEKVPHYLRWYQRMRGATADLRPATGDLASLITDLTELTRLLDRPESSRVGDVVETLERLSALESRIEAAADDAAIRRLADRSPLAGDAWQAEQILETPLLSASARARLLGAVQEIDRELAAAYIPAKVESADNGESLTAVTSGPAAEDWTTLLALARLESTYVSLCDVGAAEGDQTGSGTGAAALCQAAVLKAFDVLEKRHQAVLASIAAGEVSSKSPQVESLWSAYRDFGESLASFYRQDGLPTSATLLCDQNQVRVASQSLRLVDARDAWHLRDMDERSLSVAARVRSTLSWQAKRLEMVAAYRAPTRARTLIAAAEFYRGASAAICRRAGEPVPSAPVTLQAPPIVDLQYTSDGTFHLEIRNQGSTDTHVVFDFDGELIELEALSESQAGLATKLTSPSDRVLLDPNAEDPTIEAPAIEAPAIEDPAAEQAADVLGPDAATGSVRVAPGKRYIGKFRVARRGGATQSTKVNIDAHVMSWSSPDEPEARVPSRNGLTDYPLMARHTVDVSLPVAEVSVQQDSADYVSGIEGLRLNPFPNRISQFRFGIVNRSSITKKVSMSLYDIDRPYGSTQPKDFAELVSGRVPFSVLTITAPGDGEPAFATSGEEAEKGEEEGATDAEAKPEAEAPAAEEPPPVKSTPIGRTLLAVITDLDTEQVTYREVGFGVQRPRRFVRPRVDFNAWANRIEITASARDRSLVPAGRPVRIGCRLEKPFASGLQGKLQGTIDANELSTKLFINVPSPPPQSVRLYLDVDDYPRAFIFDVPCGKQITHVPEVTDLVDVRLMTSSEQGFLSETATIPVSVQVDAPVGTFEGGNDVIEFRIDSGLEDETPTPAPEDDSSQAPEDGPLPAPSDGPTPAPGNVPSPAPEFLPAPEALPVPAPELLPPPAPGPDATPDSESAVDLVSVPVQEPLTKGEQESELQDNTALVELQTDRSVQMGLVKAMPDGNVSLQASVSDFEIELPTGRLENVGLDVEARIVVQDDRTHVIPRIPLYIDTAPPVVGPARATNFTGFVPVGSQLKISVWAWDAGCGVKKVEAAFDMAGTGEFPAEGAATQGGQVSGREWGLVVDSGAITGQRTLLIRAVDYVGNESDPIRLPLEIVSLEEGEARAQTQTVVIAGIVIFRDDLVPGADVTLKPVAETAGDPAAEEGGVVVKTNDKGRYSIPNVAPGNYVLGSRGVIRNRVRRTEQEVTVTPGPKRTIHVDVALP